VVKEVVRVGRLCAPVGLQARPMPGGTRPPGRKYWQQPRQSQSCRTTTRLVQARVKAVCHGALHAVWLPYCQQLKGLSRRLLDLGKAYIGFVLKAAQTAAYSARCIVDS
jgi:hypothetical protein